MILSMKNVIDKVPPFKVIDGALLEDISAVVDRFYADKVQLAKDLAPLRSRFSHDTEPQRRRSSHLVFHLDVMKFLEPNEVEFHHAVTKELMTHLFKDNCVYNAMTGEMENFDGGVGASGGGTAPSRGEVVVQPAPAAAQEQSEKPTPAATASEQSAAGDLVEMQRPITRRREEEGSVREGSVRDAHMIRQRLRDEEDRLEMERKKWQVRSTRKNYWDFWLQIF